MLQSTVATSVPAATGEDSRPGPIARSARTVASAARRFLVISTIAFWLGGFTFYSGVAIPMGVEVLGSHRAVGFITQRVTNWLNVAGVATLWVLFLNLWIGRAAASRFLHNALLLTLLLMALIEIELVVLHPVLDRLITAGPRRVILDEERFDLLHQIYLISTTVQWGLGVVHVWCICLLWGREARPAAPAAAPL